MDDTEALKASSVSESIISGARAFQYLTVLGKNDIFLLQVCSAGNYLERSVMLWPPCFSPCWLQSGFFY